MHFQNITTFTYQKSLLDILFCLCLKSSKAVSVSLVNSLSKNFDDINNLINDLNLHFDILGISESKILKSQSLNINISLWNYVIEQTPTESTAGGVLLSIY